MPFEPSELILNKDGSIYHLNLKPEDLAPTVLLVGDPARVPMVSKYFDTLEVSKSKREFITHTGTLQGFRLSVVSTGIGTDNIDIVLNELDALASIDLENRVIREDPQKLELIRLGTSGSLQADIPVDSLVLSDYAIGLDGLLHYYQSEHIQRADIQLAFLDQTEWSVMKAVPYVVSADMQLNDRLDSDQVTRGFTATNPGFYAPQGRHLRLPPDDPDFLKRITAFRYEDLRITNMEMETAGIFGLAALMGHSAASLNCILANRAGGTFSQQPTQTIDRMIRYGLERLVRT
jgi:uridine phosphorylase